MLQTLAETRRFFSENNWHTIIARLNSRDTHPVIQFLKYAICGLGSATVHNGAVAVFVALWLPAAKGMLIDGVPLDDMTRAANLKLANSWAFPFGTLFAYITNTLWVFTAGRHSKIKEFLLFFVVAAIGFFPGLFVVDWLAGQLGLPSFIAQLGFVVTSVAVNFLCRKFIIFKQ